MDAEQLNSDLLQVERIILNHESYLCAMLSHRDGEQHTHGYCPAVFRIRQAWDRIRNFATEAMEERANGC